MNDLFAAFGIDWRLLLINFFNFGLLLAVLWYFLYKPLTQTLEERRQKMAQGVHDAEDAAQQLTLVEGARSEMLSKAGKEADEVVAHARAQAAIKQQELTTQAQASAEATLSEAQAQARELKRQAIEESKQEVAKLIVLGMEKAMHKSQ